MYYYHLLISKYVLMNNYKMFMPASGETPIKFLLNFTNLKIFESALIVFNITCKFTVVEQQSFK